MEGTNGTTLAKGQFRDFSLLAKLAASAASLWSFRRSP